jgi:citrate lyase subunit beta / citryl-CoA lyase
MASTQPLMSFLSVQSRDGLEAAARLGVSALVIDARTGDSALADQWHSLARPRPDLVLALPAPDAPDAHALLSASMAMRPCALLVEDIASGREVTLLDARMTVAEAELGIAQGATRLLAVAGATPSSLFAMGTLQAASARLAGLVHDPLALRRSLAVEDDSDLRRLSRALTLAAAKAAGVPAIDADAEVLAEIARRQGFSGKFYRSPDEIDTASLGFA